MAQPTLVAILRENSSCYLIKSAKTFYTVRKDRDNGMAKGEQRFSKKEYKFAYYPEKKQLFLNLNKGGEFLLGQIENTPEALEIANRLSQLSQTTS